MGGPLVVVVFRTQGLGGRGFRLKFEATGSWRYDFVNYNDTIESSIPTSMSYPEEDGTEYEFNTLSSFVLSDNYTQISIGYQLLLNVHNVDIEVCIQVHR